MKKVCILMIAASVTLTSGCATSRPQNMSAYDYQRHQQAANVISSGIIGAGLGAIIGNQIGSGHPATGAWIGGALGMTGGAMQNQRQPSLVRPYDRHRQ